MDRKVFDQDSIPQKFRTAPLNGVDLYEVSVTKLQQHYEANRFCSAEYVAWCLERARSVSSKSGSERVRC